MPLAIPLRHGQRSARSSAGDPRFPAKWRVAGRFFWSRNYLSTVDEGRRLTGERAAMRLLDAKPTHDEHGHGHHCADDGREIIAPDHAVRYLWRPRLHHGI
jgi:hypothetical protein